MQSQPIPPTSVPAIADRLRRTRAALGLSQVELCRLSGVAPNTYNQWETGKGRPELDKALLLCEALGVTLDWIYRGNASSLPRDLALKIADVDDPQPRAQTAGSKPNNGLSFTEAASSTSPNSVAIDANATRKTSRAGNKSPSRKKSAGSDR